jgi:AcrR family transcriptional regulator
MSSTTKSRRTRRAPGEVERLIVGAAREVFAAKGYAGATTREIATLAGVHEPMVYRQFSSKAALFEATVLAPFNQLISDYLDTFCPQADPSDSLDVLAPRFIEPFYDLLQEGRVLLLALLAASEFHDDFSIDRTRTLTGLGQLIERLESQLDNEVSTRAIPGIDVPAALRVAIAMVMGVAILAEWLESDGEPVGRNRLTKEMARISISGITRYTAAEGAIDGEAEGVTDRAATSLRAVEVGELLVRLGHAERRLVRAELELERASRPEQDPSRGI